MTAAVQTLQSAIERSFNVDKLGEWQALTEKANARKVAGELSPACSCYQGAIDAALGYFSSSLLDASQTNTAATMLVVSLGGLFDCHDGSATLYHAEVAAEQVVHAFQSVMSSREVDDTVKFAAAKHVPRLILQIADLRSDNPALSRRSEVLFETTQAFMRGSVTQTSH